MTTSRTVRWALKDSRELECRISLERKIIRKERNYCDGDMMDIDVYKLSSRQEIVAYIDGAKVAEGYLGLYQPIRPKDGIVAVLGGKVGLTQERQDLVDAALAECIAEVEADPEIVAYRQAEARHYEALEEHDRHEKAVEDMMTLGGQTY